MKKLVIFTLSALLVLGVSACRKEEQNRITLYQKGTYLGKADTALSADAVRNLENHTRQQAAW